MAGEYEKATRSAAEDGSWNTIVTRRSSRTLGPRAKSVGKVGAEEEAVRAE
jgi:hypothetical protein